MLALEEVFEEYGIKRGWKEQDMVFDIDEQSKEIKKITPTDWERTKIDLEAYNKKKEEVTKEGLTIEDLLLTPDERIQKLDGDIEQTEKEITETTKKAEGVQLAIAKTQSELGIEPATEIAPSVERINEEIDKLKKKKDGIEKQKERIKKEKEMQKRIEEETMRLLKEKIEEFFQILSELNETELENIFSNGGQVELSGGLKIPNDIATDLVQAYKEKITDTEELLNRFPAIKQAKSTLKKEAKKRVEAIRN
jgi:chromosome segregation ATPase